MNCSEPTTPEVSSLFANNNDTGSELPSIEAKNSTAFEVLTAANRTGGAVVGGASEGACSIPDAVTQEDSWHYIRMEAQTSDPVSITFGVQLIGGCQVLNAGERCIKDIS